MQFEIKKFEQLFFRYLMSVGLFAMLIPIAVYAYLGTFSRYLSDDYCEAYVVNRANPVSAVIERYSLGDWRAANRYSNLLFVGFSELLGENNMSITTAGMVLLWPLGLSWSVHEFRKFFKVDWSIQIDIFFGTTLGFFVLLQAPNLFQTVYWRSSMMTHFAPLVFGSFLFAFFMKQARHALDEKLGWYIYLLIFFFTFIVSGFSEPPVTTMVTALGLSLAGIGFLPLPAIRQKLSPLFASAFTGAFLGLMVMAFSPANFNMVDNDTPGVFEILRDSFSFAYIFVVYSFKEMYLPNILLAMLAGLVFFLYLQTRSFNLPTRLIWILILTSPLLMWLLIAAGFSPSVYGQGFPIERMRFLARSITCATFMFEGALLGFIFRNLEFNKSIIQWTALSLFILIGMIYPVRAAINVYRTNVPEYQTRAKLWDLRDTYIKRHASAGEQDIVVPGYSGVYRIKELDDDSTHWVNICAASYYGVNSIRAVSIPEEYLLEALNE